MSNYKIS